MFWLFLQCDAALRPALREVPRGPHWAGRRNGRNEFRAMLLERIREARDVKALSMEELEILAKEVRRAIMDRVARKGGHLGPNLGVVELTVAMVHVFDFPRDKVVFDVSHQVYTYKMLTGRAYGFIDEGRYSEVSGFSSPAESPEYDCFAIGHTSTSVALAAGLQKARDMAGGDENVIAFIGDGSLSGGEAFEGLDVAAEIGTNMIVIVNDNDMSIAENHGGLYGNLRTLARTSGKAGLNYFRSLGFDYVHVGNGHDLGGLVRALESVRGTDHPVVVHVITEKGHGYAPAVADKEGFHYAAPFDEATGRTLPTPFDGIEYFPFMAGAYNLEKARKDPRVVIVGSAVPIATGMKPEERRSLGKQYIDVGIAEECAAALISGLAKGGMKPIWTTVGTFIQRAYDQLAQDLCINGTPAVINVVGGSVFGMSDAGHVSFFDIPMLSHIPNLVYMAPTTWEEYVAMEDWAVDQDLYPVAIRLPHPGVVHSDEEYDRDYSRLNTFKMVKRGSRVAVIALGGFFQKGQRVVAALARKGIDATLINPRFITGIDEGMLNGLKADHELVAVLEDGCVDGGFGERVCRHYGPTAVRTMAFGVRKGIYHMFDVNEVLRENHLTDDLIVGDILSALGME